MIDIFTMLLYKLFAIWIDREELSINSSNKEFNFIWSKTKENKINNLTVFELWKYI